MVADYSGVSVSSVIKVLEKYYEPPVRKLPQVLCIDEFMAFNSDSDYKYACLLLDFTTGEIINVIRSRQKKHLYPFFYNLPKEEKENVKVLIMDMYKPYKDIAKYYLPSALVVIDPFHFVRYTVKAIDVVRINTMKAYNEDSIPYKMLQKYRKVLLKKKNPDGEKRKRVGILGGIWLNEKEILEKLLEYNPKLAEAYELGHSFLHNYSKFDYEGFKNFLRNTIERYKKSSIEDFVNVGDTYANWFKEICNSRIIELNDRNLSNGPIEGANNKIKALKRVSYGLTSFNHLRKRIFLIFSK